LLGIGLGLELVNLGVGGGSCLALGLRFLGALGGDVGAGLGERGVDLGAVLLLRDDADLLRRGSAGDRGQHSLGASGGWWRRGQFLGRGFGIDVVLSHRGAAVGAAQRLEPRGRVLEVGAILVGAPLRLALHREIGGRTGLGRDARDGGRELVERASHLPGLALGHLRCLGIIGAGVAVSGPRAEPRGDRPLDRGDDLRDRLMLRGSLGLLRRLDARHLGLDRVVRRVLGGFRIMGRLRIVCGLGIGCGWRAPSLGFTAAGAAAAPVLICFGGFACCVARALAASALAAVCICPNKRVILSGRTPRSYPRPISGLVAPRLGASFRGFAAASPPPSAEAALAAESSTGRTADTSSPPVSDASWPASAPARCADTRLTMRRRTRGQPRDLSTSCSAAPRCILGGVIPGGPGCRLPVARSDDP